MESFSSIISPTYARRRQASPPLRTSCSSKHKLNGVFFEHYVPNIRSQATSLTPLQTSCSSKDKLNGVFFEYYVPDMRSQATSLTSFADKPLLEAQTQRSLFRALCPQHVLVGDKHHLH
ncbi:unnamed protein product [Prunus armeniaca]